MKFVDLLVNLHDQRVRYTRYVRYICCDAYCTRSRASNESIFDLLLSVCIVHILIVEKVLKERGHAANTHNHLKPFRESSMATAI